jgi:hypothetical protein
MSMLKHMVVFSMRHVLGFDKRRLPKVWRAWKTPTTLGCAVYIMCEFQATFTEHQHSDHAAEVEHGLAHTRDSANGPADTGPAFCARHLGGSSGLVQPSLQDTLVDAIPSPVQPPASRSVSKSCTRLFVSKHELHLSM